MNNQRKRMYVSGFRFPVRGLFLASMLFSTAFLWRCASIYAPEGGPKDSLPPQVVLMTPEQGTRRFDQQRITITFDEFIQLKDQQKEFYTSPVMAKKPLLTIKGRGVQIDLRDSLLPNTTYSLNFGNSIRDNNEGNPLPGFRYVFSTGDEIDSMMMSGYAVDAFTGDSAARTLVFFYDPAVDSVPERDSTLFNALPLAMGRAEGNGIFFMQNLRPQPYRVYAVQDLNDNQQYEPGVDKVGFLDGSFDPADLPPFSVWYDTTRNYLTADPQLYFRMFMDKGFRRQNFNGSERPLQHKVMLYFGAPDPKIDTLRIDGIPDERIIREYLTKGRDTMALWLNVPSDSLPDTLRGRLAYYKHDSLNNLVLTGTDLRLGWAYFESREERREREKEEKLKAKAEEDGTEYTPPVKPNLFAYQTTAKGEVNPENNLAFTFDYPLVFMDSTSFKLIREGEEGRRYKVKYEVVADTSDMHRWLVAASWMPGQKYNLEIPAGAFRDVAGLSNDTLKLDFTILSPDKYGTLEVNVKGKMPQSKYILRLMDEKGKQLLEEKPFVSTGTYTFRYIKPGNVQLHVIEDVNGNGVWDTGSLIERRQPERVEVFRTATGDELLPMKVNWEIAYDLDMEQLFAPITMQRVVDQLRRSEAVRLRRREEEAEEKRQKEMQGANFRPQNQDGAVAGGFQNPNLSNNIYGR